MKRITLIITILILALAMTLLIFTDFGSETSIPTNQTHIYTKAICNQTNYCQEYEVGCQGKQLIKMDAITGAFVQYSRNWQDPRDEEMINKIC